MGSGNVKSPELWLWAWIYLGAQTVLQGIYTSVSALFSIGCILRQMLSLQ